MVAYAFYVTRERPEGDPKNGWEPLEKTSFADCLVPIPPAPPRLNLRKGRRVN